MKRSIAGIALAGAGIAVYVKLMRPAMLSWGSNAFERHSIWPGDELLPVRIAEATHAITISAPTQCVWPWLAQIGQDRAGFYSFTPLENLAGADIHNADEIHPEWQHRSAGDKVWLANRARYRGSACIIVARWIPGHSLVLVPPPDWDPDSGRTERAIGRLVVPSGSCSRRARVPPGGQDSGRSWASGFGKGGSLRLLGTGARGDGDGNASRHQTAGGIPGECERLGSVRMTIARAGAAARCRCGSSAPARSSEGHSARRRHR